MIDQTLGSFLRREREKRGLTLEQVSAATKVSLKILQALEEDAYSNLPAKPFLRGFVASYVRFIGLDPQEILTRFHRFIEEKLQERPSRENSLKGYAFDKKEMDTSRSVLWITMTSFAVVGGVAILLLKPALKQHRRSPVDVLRSTPSPTLDPVATVGAVVMPTVSVTGVPTAAATSVPLSSSPTAVAKPTASPSPRATVVPTAVPGASPTTTATPEDPLQKNTNLPASEVKYLLLFRALDDVYVEYRVDELRPMTIRVKKGLMLVMKARTGLKVHVKAHERIELRYRTKEFVAFSGVPGVVMDDQGVSLTLP